MEPVVVDTLKNFIFVFHQAICDKNVGSIQSSYENTFPKIISQFYQQTPLPPAESIAPLVEDDELFLSLYNELYFRHLYSTFHHNKLTINQRKESWENYTKLFNFILNSSEKDQRTLDLPVVWIYQILSEFIYQFQEFSQNKNRLKSKTDEEIEQLKGNPHVWNVKSVLNYLHSFVDLTKKRKGNTSNLHEVFSYFSQIGLLRVNCLLGDYHSGLKSVSSIDTNKKGLFTKVTTAHVDLYYYSGFCYLMMKRFVDAIRTFSNILLYISRLTSGKQHSNRGYVQNELSKKESQMYGLLAIALVFCPQRIDETINSNLREKYAEKISKMQQGDVVKGIEEIFPFCAPKFINPSTPDFDSLQNYHNEGRTQMKIFIDEVQHQSILPTIRSFLKLYTTIEIPKLAKFLEVDENQLMVDLLCYSHKNRTQICKPGSAGMWSNSNDTDFYIDDQGMVNVVETKVTRKTYGDFFIRHLNKFQEIAGSLE